ncbi:ZMPSTE24 [Cordylochernes scorpioides]|uniref:CAAX prenyl protease n=1 Tax=Cordylochernes scorpioides TaxID=51811 RepID=A0ABY6LLA8_9ARAC|nr:ZMPSTE24 [Cordylochernes scorpioides]
MDIIHSKLAQAVHVFWTENNILIGVLATTWIFFLWELYLAYRQHRIYSSATSLPPELVGVMDPKAFAKARLYQLDKSTFNFISMTWDQILSTLVLCYMVHHWLWEASRQALGIVGVHSPNEITQTSMFILVGSLLSSLISLPLSIYSTFVIEARHGFNKQTPGFYAVDKLKKFVVTQALMNPILCGVVYIIMVGGDYFFFYLWLFCVLVMLVLMTVYPDYIAPLFDKFTPLPEGQLKEEIEKMAASISFPLTKVYIVEGSKRSTHSNAYFYGFYKNKRIVLFDTLLAAPEEKDQSNQEEKSEEGKPKNLGCTNNEVLAVLGHELGHWKLNHAVKNIIISQSNLLLVFALFSLLYQDQVLYRTFGFTRSKPILIGLCIIIQHIFEIYNQLLSFLMGVLSRHFEFEADRFAKNMHKAADLRSALIKLNEDNLSFPIYDWLYSAWHHSHPPLLSRLQALGKVE